MASDVRRKRKQDLSQISTLEKCPRVEENDSQEVFCVDSDCEVDDGDCVVVSEKITIKRGRCQNPACLSPDGSKLQKASRRVQDFYGHVCKKGRKWKICDICYSRAEEHLGKLKNKFINHVPIVGGQFPFYGEMVALEEEDSTDDDDEERLDDTVAEFMSNCAPDMVNTIFEKFDINFQVEEGVKKLLEGYEKAESEIEAQIKSCDEIASSFRSSCDDFYKETDYYKEELPPIEIYSDPEEVTIDDNSDGDDVIVVESVRSLQNLPEAESQPHSVCPNEESVTEQAPEARTIEPNVSPATTKQQRVFGELRTIVKFSGGNSGSPSTKTNVVNGCIPDKGNSVPQRVAVHVSGTGEMLRDSNTQPPQKESSAKKHQTLSEGESAPVQRVPLQQLLQKGLSVLGAQPATTKVQEKVAHEQQQQPSTQLSKEPANEQLSVQLHKRLQQRFSVLNPTTETTSAQEKHQNEARLLHGHTAIVSQQKQGAENIRSMQQQQQVGKMTMLHNTANQQTSQMHLQSSGYYKSQPPQHLSEQCIQQVPPQAPGYTSAQPNAQLTPRILQYESHFPRHANDQSIVQTMRNPTERNTSKELSYHSGQTVCPPQQLSAQRNSTQLTSQTSLQQSGQHVISGAQDSNARNMYHTSKQSIQPTAAQLPPAPSEKSVLQLSQPSRQTLACAQQQSSGSFSQPVQRPSGQYIPQPLQQSSGKSLSHHSQSVVQLQLQSDSKHKSLPQQQSSGQIFYQSPQQPGGGNATQALQALNKNYVPQPSAEHASCGARTIQKPNLVGTATSLQLSNEMPLLKTAPTVQSTRTVEASTQWQGSTQLNPRIADSVVHQNMQKRPHLVTGQVPHQTKECPNRGAGSQPQQCQSGQSVPQGPQCPAVQASLHLVSSAKCVSRSPQQATQQNLQQQHSPQKLLQSANQFSGQSELQKLLQPSVKCAPVSPQPTNHVIRHSLENSVIEARVKSSVENTSNHLVHQSRHFTPQTLQNSSVTSLPPSSQPNVPSLNLSLQQGIRQTTQPVSQPQVTRPPILTESQNRQNLAMNQEKKNEETVAKTHQQPNGLKNLQSTCQNSGQHVQKNCQISKSQWGPQCPQKQNVHPVPQSPQQSGEQMVSQTANQYSGQSVIQISALCNQQHTSQSIRELGEPNLLKLQQQQQYHHHHQQQQQQQQPQATSHVVFTGGTTNRRETESYLQRQSESIMPRNPLISSKPVQNLQMDVEPPQKQGPVVSELGLKHLEQQQKQYTQSSSSQEPQQHTPFTMSDMGSHQTSSKTQIQGPKSQSETLEERTQQSLNNAILQQNMSQPLQQLKNRQSEKTDLKVQPVIPLQKSQSSNQEGSSHHSNQQISSSVPVSQSVPHQIQSLSTSNLQIPANVPQQSLVSQFPGNLIVMLQQQQVTMMLGFICDILSRFLPMVMQQQCGKESTQVEAAPSSVNTGSSQEQTSKVTVNEDDSRLPGKDGNEISDTESMCHSPIDSSSPFSTPTKSLLCTSPSTLSSSTDSDISVSDSIEVCAEKDVVPVGNVIVKESNLPPLGLVNRPPVATGDSMYIMNDIKRPWIIATVQDIITQDKQVLYTVQYVNSRNKNMKEIKKVAGFQLAYSQVQDFRFSVGHRVISIFRDGVSDEDYYSGVIAEPPKSINRYRYLVFFDNGGSQYVKHEDIRLVVDSSQSVWEDVHIEIQEFVKNYLEKYPERALLKVQEGQDVRTEWNRRWYNAKVLEVDGSLARMSFPPNGKHVEWIYRGSARFYPLFEAHNRTSKEQFARSKAFARKKGDPYIQYTLKEEEELDKEVKAADKHEATVEESEPTHRSTARKSTSQTAAQYPRLSSSVKAPKRIFYPCYSQVTYNTHRCKPSCLTAGNADKDFASYRNLLSHLSEPMLYGWTREKVKHSEYVSVYYRAPCKRRLRNIEELHKYLLLTKSKLTVDQFDFDHWVRCFTEGINEKYFIKIEDISNGVEAVPVPCINSVDSRKPDEIDYVTKHVPTNGTFIETDPEFLVCCDCTDDCLDKEKCACWRQTMEGVKYGPESESPNHEGYYYKRLYEPLVTGIYECNSRCKCSSTCLNRLVQLPMKCKVQVFMTPNRGWGIRALHDIPKGNFICLYAGHVLPENVGDALAKEVGDEYQADLDYIESAEKVKEDYEENPYESEVEEECGKRQNSKQRGQSTSSRKSTGKQHKTVPPSTRVLFGRNGRYILDAKTCGNVGRFINHSCNANLFAQNVFVDTHDLRFPWVAFFTNSFVPAHTELTWNYGYDVDSVPERVIICKCGESNCQGRLL